ncbi:hypothetical protein ACMC9I_10205 [Deinococcota bacterium DY0809b]
MKRLLLFLGLSLTLAACSLAPITIDLLPTLQQNGADAGTQTVTAAGNLDLMLPDASGYGVSGYDVPSLRPNQVKLEYALVLTQDGGLSGSAELRFYLAPAGADLWSASEQVGDPIAVDLGQTSTTLSGSLELSPEQIDTLMSGTLTVGARVVGTANGTATVGYRFDRLVLKVAFF